MTQQPYRARRQLSATRKGEERGPGPVAWRVQVSAASAFPQDQTFRNRACLSLRDPKLAGKISTARSRMLRNRKQLFKKSVTFHHEIRRDGGQGHPQPRTLCTYEEAPSEYTEMIAPPTQNFFHGGFADKNL